MFCIQTGTPARDLPPLPEPIDAAWHARTGDVSVWRSGTVLIIDVREVAERGDPPIPEGDAATHRRVIRCRSESRAAARWLEEVEPLARLYGPPIA